ncbi:MAG: apolipoprotein N-acyltransferase [Alphaproteobacteria bacterium]|nr:apolipoprotein N-acyltransferase [Alphaproteobacteria bacterium]
MGVPFFARLEARVTGLPAWPRRGLLVGLGILATGALPPLHLLPLLPVAFTPLLWLIDGAPGARRAAALGWWFGLGHFASGLYWIAHALLTEPERFGWMIPIAVFGLGGVLAVYVAAAAALTHALARGLTCRLLAFAGAWTLMELLRARLLSGFPWNQLGSAWVAFEPVLQGAALIGAYGLGLVTLLAAGAPALLAGSRRGGVAAVLAAAVLLGGSAGFGAWRLGEAPSAEVAGVRLRLVQPGVLQSHKWDPVLREGIFQRHLAMSLAPAALAPTHIIWAETATPFVLARDPERRHRIAEITPPGGVVITGAVRAVPGGNSVFQLWNSLYAIDRQGSIVATYDKAHLVPFGEYVPLRGLLPLQKITAGSVDFSAGPGPTTVTVPGLPPFGALICYEIIFPHEVVDPSRRPGFLLNLTNDAWFGISAGPYQHFAAAQLRAVEQGLPVVRAANFGISGVIDPWGRVPARLGLGAVGVVDAGLPAALSGQTPYARFGDGLPAGLALVALGVAFLHRRLKTSGGIH